jgi:hypothetical protein
MRSCRVHRTELFKVSRDSDDRCVRVRVFGFANHASSRRCVSQVSAVVSMELGPDSEPLFACHPPNSLVTEVTVLRIEETVV